MRQDIEVFLAEWVQNHPPPPRKSDTQRRLEQIVPTIAHLRSLGCGWAELAARLAEAGLTDRNGQAMKAETLRRKAVRAGYREPPSDDVESRSDKTQPDETVARGSEAHAPAASMPVPSRSARPDTDKGKAAQGGVFSTVRDKSRPRRLADPTPYSTEDITEDANAQPSETEGGQ